MIDEGKIITQGHIDEVLKAHDHQSLEELFINLTGKAYRN
jgi:hypothetical protein